MRLIETPQGEFFWGYDKDSILRALETTGEWEPQVVKHFGRPYRGTVALEVGANIGAHTRILADFYTQVIAIEPLTMKALAANTIHLANVERYEIAAYSHDCVMGMVMQLAQLTDDVYNQDNCPSVGSVAMVPLMKNGCAPYYSGRALDLIVGFRDIGLIKVDAQGCDLPALIGLEQTILRCHPKLIVEFEPNLAKLHGHNEQNYRDWFTAHDYKTEDIDGVNAVAVWRGWGG